MTPLLRDVPSLYLVTDRAATHGRPLETVVAAALTAARGRAVGTIAVQLREKDLPTRRLLALAETLRRITAQAGAALYINDRVDVAMAVGADGVHLGGGSLAPSDVQRAAPALAVAVSTHHPADVTRLAGATNVRFVVFGPLFDTPSKRRFGPPVGLASLAAAASVGIPVIALGGVTPDRVASCRAAGAAGVACVRAVMGARDVEGASLDFLRALSL